MIVPVVWWNRNPDADATGYWDHGLLRDLLAGWVRSAPDVVEAYARAKGAIVVVPGRHNVQHVEALNRDLAMLDWAVVVVTGDEEDRFPWRDVGTPAMRCLLSVWKMGGRIEAMDGSTQPLGSGYPPWLRERLPEAAPEKHGWFFAGQLNNARRDACAHMLSRIDGGTFVPTPGFAQGLDHDEYAARLAAARYVPCPSGSHTPDTFRLYEALEAGCIPIADAATPDGPQPDYWTFVFGEDPPFPQISEWSTLPVLLRDLDREWPANANRVTAWWQEWKHRLREHLRADVSIASGIRRDHVGISAVIPTSPTSQHPSTDALCEVVSSVRAQLPDAPIIVAADGVRPEQEHLRAAYDEYVRRVLWLAGHHWSNVRMVLADEWGHQANTARLALEHVETPLIVFVEHDTPLVGDIDWDGIADVIHSGRANVVRLSHEAVLPGEHRHLMLDHLPRSIHGVPLIRTVQWSQRPHVARTLWYRETLDRFFGPSSRTMIEDCLHGVVQNIWNLYGEAGWEQWRLFLYAPDGDMKRSTHLDTRGGEPKFEMQFGYPTDVVPEGAPQPT